MLHKIQWIHLNEYDYPLTYSLYTINTLGSGGQADFLTVLSAFIKSGTEFINYTHHYPEDKNLNWDDAHKKIKPISKQELSFYVDPTPELLEEIKNKLESCVSASSKRTVQAQSKKNKNRNR